MRSRTANFRRGPFVSRSTAAMRTTYSRPSLRGYNHAWVFPQVQDSLEGPDPHRNWRAWEPIPGPRQASYLEIYEVLVKLPDAEREQAMEQLRRGATYT